MKANNKLQLVSLFNLLRAFGLAITQKAAANLSVVNWSARDRQRGASALEYIVLAAALIIIIGVAVMAVDLDGIFDTLFSDATKPKPD